MDVVVANCQALSGSPPAHLPAFHSFEIPPNLNWMQVRQVWSLQ